MKRYIITLLIAAALIWGAVSSVGFSARSCSGVKEELSKEIENIDSKAFPKGERLKNAEEIWEDKKSMFAFIVSYDKIRAVDIQFAVCNSWSKCEEDDEYSASLWNLYALVDTLEKLDTPNPSKPF